MNDAMEALINEERVACLHKWRAHGGMAGCQVFLSNEELIVKVTSQTPATSLPAINIVAAHCGLPPGTSRVVIMCRRTQEGS